MLRSPRALLLDFGGVLVDSPRQPSAPPELVAQLYNLVQGAVSVERIVQDLAAGNRRYADWRDQGSLKQSSPEMTHEKMWDEFIVTQWPQAAREAVRRNAMSLSYAWSWNDGWTVRLGILETLRAATDANLSLAVVSNALCGAAHRDFLVAANLDEWFSVQIYSDEVGLRKPSPELARLAARELDVPIRDCWFVGDMVDRDILCARRAGSGSVLMRSSRTEGSRRMIDVEPDAVVDDGYGLFDLLMQWIRL